MTFKVVYDPKNGQVLQDSHIDEFAKEFINIYNYSSDKHMKLTVGTEPMFNRFRVAIARQELDINDTQFFINDVPVKITSYGGMVTGCNPFINERWMEELLEYAISSGPLHTI